MGYPIDHIANQIAAKFLGSNKQANINHILTDSRKLLYPETTLFFALETNQNDGHLYIPDLIDRGVNNFVISNNSYVQSKEGVNFLLVDNVLKALQLLVSIHRQQFHYPVIGITGSNGKTIVKEWLHELLQSKYAIIRSPRSYNSQIGVPLSVWAMSGNDNLGIFEAGISAKQEMTALEKIIQPTIGIITSIGTAHQEGFLSIQDKLEEKLLLFKGSKIVIAPYSICELLQNKSTHNWLTWGTEITADLIIQDKQIQQNQTYLELVYLGNKMRLNLPFADQASIENAITCILTMLYLGCDFAYIAERITKLMHMDMRLQINKGINGSALLNDSYSNDLYALQIGFEYAKQQAGAMPICLIISDIGSVQNTNLDYVELLAQILTWPIHQLITIGPLFEKAAQSITTKTAIKPLAFKDAKSMLAQLDTASFKDSFIMIKGARQFELEAIHDALQLKSHQTLVEVNLTALVNNYKKIKNMVGPKVQIMAMVKAFGYGTGSIEVARALQFHHVDYFSVAYADEGVELRKANIHIPIMVMNVGMSNFSDLVQYHLEPEIYSFDLFHDFANYISKQGIPSFPIHIKLNTGMNRLGFDDNEVEKLAVLLKTNSHLKVQSIFSHLSASGSIQHAAFTNQQLLQFNNNAAIIEAAIGHPVIKHIANSDAILSGNHFHLDMVRVGIGMYGVQSNQWEFENVIQLFTTISQIRTIEPDQKVGYNLAGAVQKHTRVATVRVGYADGYNRKLGRGNAYMWIQGKPAKVIGDICMDMTMVDITDIPEAKQGDRVEVYGANIPVSKVAEWAETIPYEILTSIGQRVKRIYLQD